MSYSKDRRQQMSPTSCAPSVSTEAGWYAERASFKEVDEHLASEACARGLGSAGPINEQKVYVRMLYTPSPCLDMGIIEDRADVQPFCHGVDDLNLFIKFST